ncbi:MAG: thiamine phosphate synthase [Methanomicrobiales archaeon]|nr:thiamine phosphate synthase [Methanomicrobiales archaeon]
MPYDLYVVTDEKLREGLTHKQIAKEAVSGGADVIQLRDKEMTGRELFIAACEIRDITRSAGTLFIVNDRIDIALASGADGVHLGQDDLPLYEARQLAPEGFILGISVGSVVEAVCAEAGGAGYVAVSPVFETGTKPDAGPGHGTSLITAIRKNISIPVIGIGGIQKENVREVLASGADGIAVISAVISSDDIAKATRELKSLIRQYKQTCNNY